MHTQDTQTNGRGDSAALSYDGHGINGTDEYRTRLCTFTDSAKQDGKAAEFGPLFAAAPAMLEALRDCVTLPGALAERSHEYALRRLQRITETALEAIAQATGQTD